MAYAPTLVFLLYRSSVHILWPVNGIVSYDKLNIHPWHTCHTVNQIEMLVDSQIKINTLVYT